MKMYKLIVILLGYMLLITGCGKNENMQKQPETAEINEEVMEETEEKEEVEIIEEVKKKEEAEGIKEVENDTEASSDDYRNVYNQLTIMAENKDMWTEDYESLGYTVNYAVTDLDKNGRYELIVSGMGGTGLYTTNRIFEINENYDGLTECILEFEDGVEPDLAYYTLETYVEEDGKIHYAVIDVERNNPYGSYEQIFDFVLEQGKVTTSEIASKETIIEDEETLTLIYADSEGNIITEEEYENAAKNYFDECEKTVTNVGWKDIKELEKDTEGIRTQLEESL